MKVLKGCFLGLAVVGMMLLSVSTSYAIVGMGSGGRGAGGGGGIDLDDYTLDPSFDSNVKLKTVYNYENGARIGLNDLANHVVYHYSNGNIAYIESEMPDINAINDALGTDYASMDEFLVAVEEAIEAGAPIHGLESLDDAIQLMTEHTIWTKTNYFYVDGSLERTETVVVNEFGNIETHGDGTPMYNQTFYENGKRVRVIGWVVDDKETDANDLDGDQDQDENELIWKQREATYNYEDGFLVSAQGYLALLGVSGVGDEQGFVHYDALGRTDYVNGAMTNEDGTLILDAEGNIQENENAKILQYKYNSRGNLDTVTSYGADGQVAKVQKYIYSDGGVLQAVQTLINGNVTSNTQYIYDDKGELIKTVDTVNDLAATSSDVSEDGTTITETVQVSRDVTYYVVGKPVFVVQENMAQYTKDLSVTSHDPWTHGELDLDENGNLILLVDPKACNGTEFYNTDPTKVAGKTETIEKDGKTYYVFRIATVDTDDKAKLQALAEEGGHTINYLWTGFAKSDDGTVYLVQRRTSENDGHLTNDDGAQVEQFGGQWNRNEGFVLIN